MSNLSGNLEVRKVFALFSFEGLVSLVVLQNFEDVSKGGSPDLGGELLSSAAGLFL